MDVTRLRKSCTHSLRAAGEERKHHQRITAAGTSQTGTISMEDWKLKYSPESQADEEETAH
jgi:hypothetical protein